MEDIKKIIGQLFKAFEQEEVGNRVTSNNMFALFTKVSMVLDGKITLNPPKEVKDDKAGTAE